MVVMMMMVSAQALGQGFKTHITSLHGIMTAVMIIIGDDDDHHHPQ